jgi:plastocyanin
MYPRTLGVVAGMASALLLSTTTLAATVTVEVRDNFFSPENVTICLGDTVHWTWVGAMDHSVTSGSGCLGDNGAWDSGVQSPGASFDFVFTSIPPECATDPSAGANTCDYFCVPHCVEMSGVITIADMSTADLMLSRNKLRIAHDTTEGRGGVVGGLEMLSGASFDDVVPGTTSVTLTLTGPGVPPGVTDTAMLSESRGNFMARLPENNAEMLNLRAVSIRGTTDPTEDKVVIKYQTNGFDLAAAGPLTLTVEIEHDVDGACGATTVVASTSGIVQM